jgi:succinyl-CoA synthetase beta subunit
VLPLLENQTKAWLLQRGFPVPKGRAAATSDLAEMIARDMVGGSVVKALIPAGRRGKSGGVRLASDPRDAGQSAREIIGGTVAGHKVAQVYVEERLEIETELYLSFSLSSGRLQVLLSQQGGVDIEDTFANSRENVVAESIDPLAGLSRWKAIDLWSRAGVQGPVLRALADLTAELFDAFRTADAEMLEINPLAICSDGRLSLVGAMMAIDEYALFRHPEWRSAATTGDEHQGHNEREQRVRTANAALPGGEAQYVELDGDIGLLVGGGGAGLYIHDVILALGGRPANHCVTPPTSSNTQKLKEVIRAILDNPRLQGLLIGFNFAQMARADIRIEALAEVLRERDLTRFNLPIVVRLFGPGEEQARKVAADFRNITYLPRGTSLFEACRAIVDKTRRAA